MEKSTIPGECGLRVLNRSSEKEGRIDSVLHPTRCSCCCGFNVPFCSVSVFAPKANALFPFLELSQTL